MRTFTFWVFIGLLTPSFSVAGPNLNGALPSVNQEANKVIQSTKAINPLSDCFNGSMFTSQSPAVSAKQISACVTRKINNLPGLSPELKAQVKDIPNMGWSQLIKLKNCFNSLEALKQCTPTDSLLTHH